MKKEQIYKEIMEDPHVHPSAKGIIKEIRDKEIVERKLQKDYEKYIKHSKEGALQYIADIALGYDGNFTVEGLTGLIDEIRAVALLGLKQKE